MMQAFITTETIHALCNLCTFTCVTHGEKITESQQRRRVNLPSSPVLRLAPSTITTSSLPTVAVLLSVVHDTLITNRLTSSLYCGSASCSCQLKAEMTRHVQCAVISRKHTVQQEKQNTAPLSGYMEAKHVSTCNKSERSVKISHIT